MDSVHADLEPLDFAVTIASQDTGASQTVGLASATGALRNVTHGLAAASTVEATHKGSAARVVCLDTMGTHYWHQVGTAVPAPALRHLVLGATLPLPATKIVTPEV